MMENARLETCNGNDEGEGSKVRPVVELEMMHRCLYVCLQVHLRRAEEQASHPGHPPAAVPEGSRRDLGSQGGLSLLIYKHTHTQDLLWQQTSRPPARTNWNVNNLTLVGCQSCDGAATLKYLHSTFMT